jgi:hypothetical protein
VTALENDDEYRDILRTRRRREVRLAASAVRKLEKHLARAVANRDEKLRQHHGPVKDGMLSYADLAAEAGLSRNRIIQIVQPPRNEES